MNGTKVFAIGVLVLCGVLYVAAVIVAMAPYLALILVGLIVTGIATVRFKGPPDPPDEQNQIE